MLATVQGQRPVTVGLLDHGARPSSSTTASDNATQKKRLNKAKGTTLDALVSVRVVANEVERLGIPKTAEFQRRVEARTREPGVRGLRAKGGRSPA